MRADPVPALKKQLGQVVAAALLGCPSYNAAATLGTDVSRIADLRRERLGRFSLETLVRYAERLGRTVTLCVGDGTGGSGVEPRNH